MQDWILEELHTVRLRHRRLHRRYHLVLDALARKPALKFTAACHSPAEVEGAYRFVNNPHVSHAQLLAPHYTATRHRCQAQPVVLAVQDTTELDLTRPHEQLDGAGPLGDGDRWGFLLHPLMAFTPQGLPLGLLDVKIWARDPDRVGGDAAGKAARRKRTPLEDKESVRWLEGYRAASALAAACPDTQVICLSDSEGDLFECFGAAEPAAGRQADWIVRACEDRAVRPTAAAPARRLFAQVAQAAVRATLTVAVRPRAAQSGDGRRRKQARSARTATVTVQAATVTLRPPPRPGGRRLAAVTVQAVLVREVAPPAGEEPIEWLLLTSLPIDTLEQVLRVVDCYCKRWQIEIYFKVLKSGCQVERSQLERAAGFLAYLALCLLVAWRVQQLLMLGRECPELPCDCVLSTAEWQSVYAVVRRQAPPATPPPLGEMVELIARLGGYLGRKGDGPPGPKALWVGLQRMADLALAWEARSQPAPGTPQATPPPPRADATPDPAARHEAAAMPP